MQDPPNPVYEFGEFRLDPANSLLQRKGVSVALTPKVFDTLVLLVESSGRLVPTEEFVRRLWPETFVEQGAVAENVSRLRRALREEGGQAFIETVPKRGYRFVASVASVRRAEAVQTSTAVPGLETTAKSRRGHKTPRAAALALILLGGLASGYALVRQRDAAHAPVRALAVLPIENLSGSAEQEYLADGMTDELITQLARIRALRVISRTSVMRFKGIRKPLSEIARELNVDAVVEGTVLRSAERVRVTVQVIQVNPERHLWAERYERRFGDLVTLEGELAREISQAVRITLTPLETTHLAGLQPVDPAAYEAFLKGRFYWNKRTEDATRKAIEYFEQAIAADPRNALAYTGLADSYLSALQEAEPLREKLSKARAMADRALALDPGLAEAHASVGQVLFFERDWSEAETELRRAIALNPNYANAHMWYALCLVSLRQPQAALDELERARALDPLSLPINANLALALGRAGRYDEAVAQARKALELDPGFALGHYRLGQICVLAGRYGQAVAPLERAIALSGGSPRATAELGLAEARSGHRSRAQALLGDLKQRATERYVQPFTMAVIYGGLGDKDQALAWHERAYEDHSPELNFLEQSPAFEGLRGDPRFMDLVRRVGLPPAPQPSGLQAP